ncbi:ribokinase [Intrasporangium sp.]|uniref:ribokinase n=1 Tax=Intrasporangium sp. TaxID=1925024 RepID=UPI0032214331
MSGAVAVVGSLNIDLTVRTERFPEPGETLTGSELVTAPGGKGSNQAVAAAVLGSRVHLVGAVGADANGDVLLHHGRAAGVDVTAVRRLEDHATGSAMIVVNAAGENTIIVSPGANGALRPDAVTRAGLGGATVLCLCLEVPVETVLAAARVGQQAGAQVLFNLSPYAAVPPELLAATDVLLVNRAEAGLLLGGQSVGPGWRGALDGLRTLGIERAIVTLGAEGSVVLDAADPQAPVTEVAAVPVDVVDTTGCGDAFTGAVAHRLAAGSSLVEAARFAAEVSALAATAAGAQSSYGRFAHLGG